MLIGGKNEFEMTEGSDQVSLLDLGKREWKPSQKQKNLPYKAYYHGCALVKVKDAEGE